jgi:hypothetical protein
MTQWMSREAAASCSRGRKPTDCSGLVDNKPRSGDTHSMSPLRGF